LIEHPELNLNDIAYTLQIGRVEFDYRSCFVCESIEHAITQLKEPEYIEHYEFATEKSPILIFMFDESNQLTCIDSTLYETESVFRETIYYCSHFLLSHLQIDLREVLYTHK